MTDCLFCSIVRGDLPAQVVWNGPAAMAFEDLAPKAPVHVLVIPKVHVSDLTELAGNPAVTVALIEAIATTASHLGVSSYRTIFNTGAGSGQSVFHVHAHLLAGGDVLPGFTHG